MLEDDAGLDSDDAGGRREAEDLVHPGLEHIANSGRLTESC